MHLDTAPLPPVAVPSIAIRPGLVPPPKSTDHVLTPTPNETAPSLILFGRDDRGRVRASSFTAADADAAN